MSPQPKASVSSSPVLSTSHGSASIQTTRKRLERQLAEYENQLKEPNSRTRKSLLTSQIAELKERLNELDKLEHTSTAVDTLQVSAADKLRAKQHGLRHTRSSSKLRPAFDPKSSTPNPPPSGVELPASLLPLPPPLTTPTKRRAKVPDTDRRKPDIEFATEIGQGLLLEVRKMQALLQEKEERLSQVQIQKAEMERAAENMAKQLRQREEAQEKLKEDTWNLELAKQELTISVTELQQDLARTTSEHARAIKQVGDLRLENDRMQDSKEKLNATIEDMKTRHQHDMSAMRRHAATLQRDKVDQQKQIDALTSELAIAKAHSRIVRQRNGNVQQPGGTDDMDGLSPDTSATEKDTCDNSPGTSPPSSPKQAPVRNQALEIDTLKTSLAHAHRMVSNLRSGLRREKAEKFEFKKLLAESQETIEQMQQDMWIDVDRPATSRPQRKIKRRKASMPRVLRPARSGSVSKEGRPDGDEQDALSYYSDDGDLSEQEDAIMMEQVMEPLSLDPALTEEHPHQTLADQLSAAADTTTFPQEHLQQTLADQLSAADGTRASPQEHPQQTLADQLSAAAVTASPIKSIADAAIQTDKQDSTDVGTQSCSASKQSGHTIAVQTDGLDSMNACTQSVTTSEHIQHSIAVQTDELETADAGTQSATTSKQSQQNTAVQTDGPSLEILPMAGTSARPPSNNSIHTQTVSLKPAEAVGLGAIQTVRTDNNSLNESRAGPAASSSDAHEFSLPAIADVSGIDLFDGATTSFGVPPVKSDNTIAAPRTATSSLGARAQDTHISSAEDSSAMSYNHPQQQQSNNIAAPEAAATTSTALSLPHKPQTSHLLAPDQPQAEFTDEESDDEILSSARSGTSPSPSILLSKAAARTTKTARQPSTSGHGMAYVSPQTTTAASYVIGQPPPPPQPHPSASTHSLSSIASSSSPMPEHPLLPSTPSHPDFAAGQPHTTDDVSSSAIALITQTMIGDWMWKYTRKAVGNGISEHRHKRFFWIHPYTRTLYWSARAPGADGRELRAKSAFIESISTIPDNSPAPTKVSLLVQTPGRQLRLTAQDDARHQVWFESLSYLLARASTADVDKVDRTPSLSTNSLLKKASFPRLRPVRSVSSFAGSARTRSIAADDDDDDDDDLEDVRMCCGGKHHVSKLDKCHRSRHGIS